MTKQMSIVARISAILVALVLGIGSAFAQNQTISGTVVDGQNVPVIGASVIVVGNSTIGTVTDLDGKFSLSIPAGANVEVSCIGYKSQTLSTANKSVLSIILEEDTLFLDETVVIGYGVQKKSDLTGAVGSVNAEALKGLSTTDAAQALQGKISGVNIISNGAPGSGAEIRVRGISSNSSNSDNLSPLYIVDGLQVKSIQYLDPSMIESMEVLKDAASAAIYGAEAGNGVVLVTTKTGSESKATVSYTGKFTNQNYTRRPLMNRDQLVDYLVLQGETVLDQIKAYDYKHQDYANGVIDTDWIGAYFEPSWSQQHSVSFSGGNKNGHFFASLNYVNNNGVVKGDRDVYKRLTAQINADYKLFKWLQVGTNNSIEKWDTQSVSQRGYSSSFESVLNLAPLEPVYWLSASEIKNGDYKGVYDKVMAGTDNHRLFSDEHGLLAAPAYSDVEGNPLAKILATDGTNGGFNINGTLYANLTPVKGLTITSRLGYRITQNASHSYTAPYYIGRGSQDNYSISANVNTGWYYQWENFANYNVTIAKKHDITAMIGMSYRENNWDNVSTSASGSDILAGYTPGFRYMDYVKGDVPKSVGNAPGKSSSLAYFARLIYSYDNRYSVQANFRADAFDSSKLSAKNRWGYFPSFSAGWTISNEPFFKDNISRDAVSFLKLRGSWGRNGNVNVLGGYRYLPTIAQGNNWYQYNVGVAGAGYASSPNYGAGFPNPDLKWETSQQVDLGLDARFFNSRLTFGVDYFNKKTKDLLFDVYFPGELGSNTTTVNGGTVLNDGVEFEIGWRDNIGDFSYSINGNFSTLHNEVLSVATGAARITASDASSTNYKVQTAFEEGYPIWYLRGYKYAGVDPSTGAPKYYNANDEVVEAGAISDGDMAFIGGTTPTYTFGLNINLAYKGFDFTLNGYGQGGNYILPVTHRTGTKNNFKYYAVNSWSKSNPDGSLPDPASVRGADNAFWSSSGNCFKGDYFRIQTLQLGYTLPSRITKKVAISNLRFFVSLDDFFTITKYPGLDPATASTSSTTGAGLDWGSYPTMQKLILGINLTF